MEKFTGNTNKAKYMGTNIDNVDCREDTFYTSESHELPDNYSIFHLYLNGETAGLFCSYGDISTYIKEAEYVCFLSESEVIFFNISYKKALHILNCLGYEKKSIQFMPFDTCANYDPNVQAIYYEENWTRIQ